MTLVAGGRTPTKLGLLVAKYRSERGISQGALAKTAGLTDGYVSQIETGSRGKRPSRDVVIALAQALKINPAELLQAADYEVGRDGDDTAATFRRVVETDPTLRSDQKQILLSIYESYTGRSR
jgi:transcriptional regulator with XRE-family HTH domain